MLKTFLVDAGQKVHVCTEDADTKIAQCALNISEEESKCVNVVADDTDVAVLLLYHWSPTMVDVTFNSEREK